MSSGDGIATLTTSLRSLLAQGIVEDPELADTIFTTQPPDLARTGGVTANQLNLFLYRTSVSAAWSNRILPGRTPDELAPPPLALSLGYLLTAYGRDNDSRRPFSHMLLGRAMGILNDHAVIRPDPAPAGVDTRSAGAAEPIRLTLQPLSLDEISKIWSSFQTNYRLSAAYDASVVLIESDRVTPKAKPVERRRIEVVDARGPAR